MKTKVGIDYSMTSPAICIGDGTFTHCNIRYLTPTKKYAQSYLNGKIEGYYFGEWPSDEFRYDFISNWIVAQISPTSDVILEGYAFAAKGQVFNIGENTGLLKHKLYKNNIHPQIVTPTEVKKWATNKGNASKTEMYEAFVDQTGVELKNVFGCSPESNPLSDIVDAFHIHNFTRYLV